MSVEQTSSGLKLELINKPAGFTMDLKHVHMQTMSVKAGSIDEDVQ